MGLKVGISKVSQDAITVNNITESIFFSKEYILFALPFEIMNIETLRLMKPILCYI